jgi:hypothetical protein
LRFVDFTVKALWCKAFLHAPAFFVWAARRPQPLAVERDADIRRRLSDAVSPSCGCVIHVADSFTWIRVLQKNINKLQVLIYRHAGHSLCLIQVIRVESYLQLPRTYIFF